MLAADQLDEIDIEAELAAQMDADGERPLREGGESEAAASSSDVEEVQMMDTSQARARRRPSPPRPSPDQAAVDRVNALLPRLSTLSEESLLGFAAAMNADDAAIEGVVLPPNMRELVRTSIDAELARRLQT